MSLKERLTVKLKEIKEVASDAQEDKIVELAEEALKELEEVPI